jgi:hypothetical protein
MNNPTPEAPQTEVEQPVWLPERLERAKRSSIQDLLSDLGYTDLDALKNQLQQQTQQASALESAQAALTTSRQRHLEMAFRLAAARYRFYDPHEAHALLDWSAVGWDEGGQVTGLEAALESLVKARPHLVKRAVAPNLDAGLGGPGPQYEALSPAQVDEIKRRFKLW